jgi:twitching motility protein PilT
MKNVEQLLRALLRPEVEEVALVSERLPSARVGSSFDPLDEEVLSAQAILAILVAAGGSRYVDGLGPTPKNWALRVPGLGEVNVSAALRGAQVLARFSLAGRRAPERGAQGAPAAKAVKTTAKPSQRPPPEAGRRPDLAETTRVRAQGEAFRRAPTAPAIPRAQGLNESIRPREQVTLDDPPPETPPRQHVVVKSLSFANASAARGGAGRSQLETLPPSAAMPASADFSLLFEQARSARASDLHIVAGRPPLFRIGGELRPRGDAMVAEEVERMIRPLIPERLVAVLATQGSCDFALEHPQHGRFRVNVGRQHTGLKVSLRLVPRELPTLGGLGLPPELTRATSHHQGLVVFTGPTGHGKTTTMTAVVDQINETTTHHIITVEDPVENVHKKKKALISQREVGAHTASFASALRAALREDPDVIVVGELRDVETVQMAVAASETGHLVLGTMNTPSAAKTIDRLIDLFPPADQPQVRLTLAAGLRLIVGQRLVPSPDHTRVHAAIELLPGSTPLSAIIRDNKTFQIPSLQQRGKAFGIVRLDDSLADLVKTGRATIEDVLLIAESPQELEAVLKGKPAPIASGAAAPR